ncbi:MAG: HEPN domain-containing protein [Candidatus Moranbacteria bacterium]|nr:HEPN domain-containing protein [Candidatus Moranbacteria bacterium]
MNSKNYFDELIKRGLLKKEKIGLDQVRALLASSAKNLNASRKTIAIDEETCFAMAYAAMLKIARAILFLHSLRPSDGQQHKTTIEVAGNILGSDFRELIEKFDKMRRKRNQFTYDPLLPLTDRETKEALQTAEKFSAEVRRRLEKEDSQEKLF